MINEMTRNKVGEERHERDENDTETKLFLFLVLLMINIIIVDDFLSSQRS